MNTKETFAIPCVGAIIKKDIAEEEYILIQERQKGDDRDTNGLIEFPAGKIREYENVYDTLRREVKEETGLSITKIYGEDDIVFYNESSSEILSFEPFCITQNLKDIYSIVLHTFLCEGDGDILKKSDESQNIRWIKKTELKKKVIANPECFFQMHINALRKYLQIK